MIDKDMATKKQELSQHKKSHSGKRRDHFRKSELCERENENLD